MREFIIVACFILLAAPEARGAPHGVPLVIRPSHRELTAGACGYWTAIAFSTGFDVRRGEGEDALWVADLDFEGKSLRVTLTSPDGVVRAEKSVTVQEPCADTIEILSILLAAHVPAFELAIQRQAAPAPVPPAQAPPATPEPLSEPVVAEKPPPPRKAVASHPTTQGQLLVAPTLILLASTPRASLTVGGDLQLQRWRLGLKLGGGYQRIGVSTGTATITELEARLTGGYAVVDSDRLAIQVSALAGARLTLGATTALYENGSASLLSAQLGLSAEGSWRFTESLALCLGASAVRLLPKPAFAVTGSGKVFRTPEILLELYTGLAWRIPS